MFSALEIQGRNDNGPTIYGSAKSLHKSTALDIIGTNIPFIIGTENSMLIAKEMHTNIDIEDFITLPN